MKKQDEAFLARLRATFRGEAQEHVSALAKGLAALRQATPEVPDETIEAAFREAHSLKGAARAVSLAGIEATSHALETVFAAARRGDVVPSATLLDALQRALDGLAGLLAAPAGGDLAGADAPARTLAREIETALAAARGAEPGAAVAAPPHPGAAAAAEERARAEAPPGAPETVRIPAARLSSLLAEGEEMLTAKQVAARYPVEFRELAAGLAAWRRRWTGVRAEGRPRGGRNGHGEAVARLAEFCEWSEAFLRGLEGRATTAERAAAADQRALGTMVERLLDDVKLALLLPAASLLEAFPRFVRELSHDRGKEAELVVRGAEIGIDRRVLEELKDPLVHLLRNCVDHGVEKPEARETAGKPRRATITVALAQKEGGRVEVTVEDDGAGMDLGAVRDAALRAGLVTPENAERLTAEETVALAFESGLSTSPIITDVSGRGLGLAIVREKVERLGGSVSFATRAGAGTSCRLVVPLSLAAFRGLFVRVGERSFVLPTAGVERALRVGREAIKTVENRETVEIAGEVLAVVALADVLELPPARAPRDRNGRVHLVVVVSGGRRIAFAVDEILHEQEVLLKGLGPQLPRVRNVAGATVLSTGEIVPVLYVPDLVKSAARAAAGPGRRAEMPQEIEREGKTVLVVEDSITARSLLRNVLESAGFDVRVAVDGIDALTTLKTEEIDLVVSDVDMPRMNGFDLTARIRGDAKLAELPVVLVTALDAREDRERGVEAGANAYIVKSRFDQGNLLEVIRRLI